MPPPLSANYTQITPKDPKPVQRIKMMCLLFDDGIWEYGIRHVGLERNIETFFNASFNNTMLILFQNLCMESLLMFYFYTAVLKGGRVMIYVFML